MDQALFPMTLRDHIARIRRVLENERYMRQRVFQNDPAKLAHKVRSIDDALESLGELEKEIENGQNKTP